MIVHTLQCFDQNMASLSHISPLYDSIRIHLLLRLRVQDSSLTSFHRLGAFDRLPKEMI
jgi:hypothetical protein